MIVFETDPTFRRAAGGQLELVTPLVATRHGVTWTVPAGFVTDGASVPAIFWPVVSNPYAPSSLRPAILHDWMCRTRTFSSTFAVDVFHEGLRAEGCAPLRSRAMWLAVRWFGPRFKDSRGH